MVSTGLVQRTLTGERTDETAMCHCGKICKNLRGLRVHQGRKKCGRTKQPLQRTDSASGETQENVSQVAHHSTDDLHVMDGSDDDMDSGLMDLLGLDSDQEDAQDTEQQASNPQVGDETATRQQQPLSSRKEQVKWPWQNDKKAWMKLDEDLDTILQVALQGSVERKLGALPTITYAVGLERFGMAEKHGTSRPYKPNRREEEIKRLRSEIRALGKQFKRANEEERVGLGQLRNLRRQKIQRLRRAERLRKNRKLKERRRAAFFGNPYKFTSQLLSEEKSGQLTSTKEETEKFLQEAHSDSQCKEPLGNCSRIKEVPPPSSRLDEKEPTLKEVMDVVKKARAGSAPGPSGIPYKVYKNCPRLLKRLWSLMKVVWRKGVIPYVWQIAEGCLTPKEKNSKSIAQFRSISLLSVEGKIFFSVLARRIQSYAIANSYINTSVQKGGVPGFSGCLEHTSAITQLIREAQVDKKDLTVVWLDLANAYGSIPHSLIQYALNHYHLPKRVKSLVSSYYSNLLLRFSTKEFTTEWIRVERGIVTGCTISVILFVLGMNLILKAAEEETRGPKTASGIRMPPNRGFMDDITITTQSHIQTRWILSSLEDTVSWARMKFKPKKSRCLIIRKGHVTTQCTLTIQGEAIPSIKDNPIKCLGKWFDATLKDKEAIAGMKEQLEQGLKKIQQSSLPGKFKVWMYQNGLLPRLIWPLMLYEVPTTTVERLERVINKHLRRWLGLPPSFTGLGLYTTSGKLQLPVSSLVEEFKVAKARLLMTLKDSPDQCISSAGIELRTGRKWSVCQAVEAAQGRLVHQDIVGNTNKGREGLGLKVRVSWATADKQKRRAMVQGEIRKEVEETRASQMVQLGCQGRSTGWNVPERKITWSQLWHLEPVRISFLLRSVYDVLPTPVNLKRWKLIEDPACPLCGKTATLDHILSSCQVALSQGRYRWRHDRVLRQLAHHIDLERRKKQPAKSNVTFIPFVKEGQEAKVTPSSSRVGVLATAQSWEMKVDLERKLQFPDVVQTTLRPDIVVWSSHGKKIVVIELTVPWEERCDEAYERKATKYAELMEECRRKGWSTWLFPVEVGCRGFPAASVWKMFTALGITGRNRKTAVQAVSSAAEKASSWIWLRRNHTSWS